MQDRTHCKYDAEVVVQSAVIAHCFPTLIDLVLMGESKSTETWQRWWSEVFILLVYITELQNGIFIKFIRLFPQQASRLLTALVRHHQDGQVRAEPTSMF